MAELQKKMDALKAKMAQPKRKINIQVVEANDDLFDDDDYNEMLKMHRSI